MSSRFSVDFILRVAVRRLLFFGIAAIGIAFLSQFYVLSLQSHRAACETVSARLSQFMGPLSRELAVGEIAVAGSMFEDFKKVVVKRANSYHLEMNLSGSDFENSKSESVCEASMWGANVFAPVSFAGKTVAVIQGQVTYFPTLPLIGFVVFVVASLMWGVRVWALKLVNQIESLVIEPIKQLSRGEEISSPDSLPYEVEDVSRNIDKLRNRLVEEEKNSSELAREKELSELAVQVAHDIRSPLSVLSMMERDDFQFDKQSKTLMAQAAKRIQDITQSLTQKYRKGDLHALKRGSDVALASVVLEGIFSEKRSFAEDRHILLKSVVTAEVKTAFVNVESVELGRVLSNLLDNAIEALESCERPVKEVLVTISLNCGLVEIAVSDTGPGIAADILPTLSKKGVTLKKSGTGLGLFHARQVCERAGGKFDLVSRLGHGTSVILRIPRAAKPLWFADHIDLSPGTKIVVVDDETIHRYWAVALGEREFEHLYSGDDLRMTKLANKPNHFFVVGHQLGSCHKNGLQVIRERGIANRSILLTNRFDDVAIQDEAILLGVRIVPKQILGAFGVNWLEENPNALKIDFVLIDNDPLVRQTWRMVAEGERLRVLIFEDVQSFLKARVPRDTTIFLDNQLGEDEFGNEILGTEQAKILWENGYRKIHLATSDLSITGIPPHTLSVRDKSFPRTTEFL